MLFPTVEDSPMPHDPHLHTVVITLRLPRALYADIEGARLKRNSSRNAFCAELLDVAMARYLAVEPSVFIEGEPTP